LRTDIGEDAVAVVVVAGEDEDEAAVGRSMVAIGKGMERKRGRMERKGE
jgi:hypothetical protein